MALRAAVTMSVHTHFVLGFRVKSRDSGAGGGRSDIHRLPCTGGNGGTNGHVVDMQVIVFIGCRHRGLTVERDSHGLAHVGGQGDVHMLASGGDVVVNVGGTAVVPLAQNGPCGAVVGGNQHHEPVVRLAGGDINTVRTAKIRKGKVKVKFRSAGKGRFR